MNWTRSEAWHFWKWSLIGIAVVTACMTVLIHLVVHAPWVIMGVMFLALSAMVGGMMRLWWEDLG